ncbi:MAG: MFS transporter [Betaproteobacteria bacterium]|nr:MFS transporter [Betaproteobacteria bacterium]MBL8535335.1 MFS transporter [Betaproteobacteria bacterium]
MFGWMRDLTSRERKTMSGCFGGWALDAFDMQVYSFVIPTLLTVWGISKGQAGTLGTVTLLMSAAGGWVAGMLSDRYGRVRVLQWTILWFAFFTFLCGFAQDFGQLFLFRALQGLGFGGEWAAGAVLMGEVIRDKYRGRAVGFVQSGYAIGWGGAALLYTALFALLPETLAWRMLFWIGLAPALLVVWVRRNVEEPELFHAHRANRAPVGLSHLFVAFRPQYLPTTIKATLMITGAQGGVYCLITWMPTYLKVAKQLTTTGTGAYLLVHILGAFCGFIAGALLSDAVGRKRTFLISACGSIVLILVYMFAPIDNSTVFLLGFPLGFFALMMFSPMGPFLSELYPTEVRATCQGFCYNAGRAVGAVFPALVGFLAERMPLGTAMGLYAFGAYALMMLSLIMLPETRGRSLDAIGVETGRT